VSIAAEPAPLGLYVHFPWCRHLCPYCDFPVAIARGEPPHDAYLAAVTRELDERAAEVAGRRLVSIYFGGGTPSLWRPDCLAAVVARGAGTFAADPADLEVTIEANPIDCTPERMAAWRAAGIDRVSIGVQSLEPRELVALGRDHRQGDGAAALRAARAAGFRSISADLILGVPDVPDRDAGAAAALPPHVAEVAAAVDHLSVYELTIEERTAFGKRARAGTLHPLDEDTLATLYEATDAALAAAGFEHYEISSYARPGHRAVHNSLYWRGADFLGIGVGAASFVRTPDGGGRRASNVRSAARYLDAAGAAERVAETLVSPPDELAADLIWLGLRTADGVGEDALAGRAGLADWLLAERLATRAGGRIHPTLRGFLYADRIAARVVAG
jgi:putative oxygen-independent coproporphyrinogen III oxidase